MTGVVHGKLPPHVPALLSSKSPDLRGAGGGCLVSGLGGCDSCCCYSAQSFLDPVTAEKLGWAERWALNQSLGSKS